jgi:hypothetical protein
MTYGSLFAAIRDDAAAPLEERIMELEAENAQLKIRLAAAQAEGREQAARLIEGWYDEHGPYRHLAKIQARAIRALPSGPREETAE